MRFIRVHIFNKKYLLLSCVVYRLTSVFLIQAIRDLLSSCSQMFFKRTFRPATLLKRNYNTGVLVSSNKKERESFKWLQTRKRKLQEEISKNLDEVV